MILEQLRQDLQKISQQCEMLKAQLDKDARESHIEPVGDKSAAAYLVTPNRHNILLCYGVHEDRLYAVYLAVERIAYIRNYDLCDLSQYDWRYEPVTVSRKTAPSSSVAAKLLKPDELPLPGTLEEISPLVIEAINEMLQNTWNGESARVYQRTVEDLVERKASKQGVILPKDLALIWPQIKPLFEQAGWKTTWQHASRSWIFSRNSA